MPRPDATRTLPRSRLASATTRPRREKPDRITRAVRPDRSPPLAEPEVGTGKLPLPVSALCWSLLIPWIIPLGSLAMQPYRMVLVATAIPAAIRILSGKAGRVGFADIGIIGFSLWIAAALIVNHGAGGIEQAGSEIVETMGAYMVARAYIRSARDFEALARLLFIIVAFILFPLALLEVATGRNLVLELASRVFRTPIINDQPPRMGIRRVQAMFEHPILFGVFCSGVLAMTYIVRGHALPTARRLLGTAVVAVTAILSMSSGPISTVFVQLLLFVWDRVFRTFANRWWLLIGIVGTSALVIDIFSNRSLPAILFSYFALDEASAYFRLLIWEFGSQSVLNHPVFGVGMGEWDRPSWVGFSVDMFWLVNGIVGGIPAAFFMALAFFANVFSVAFAKGLDQAEERCRLAFLITMTGFFLAGWMVHFWGATYVQFILLLGSARWIADLPQSRATTDHPRRV